MAGSEWLKSWSLKRISKRGNSSQSDKLDGGPLDPRNRLQEIYGEMGAALEKNVTALFPKVRILVVGKSGSGKSTLIRLMVGEAGPATMSYGTAGKQDIEKEWVLCDGSIPLVLHDSNGTDVKGRKRLNDIKKFLDKMQRMAKPIHLVWYIVSGIDRRLRDDGGIINLICRKKIPFLLVITHNDCDEGTVRENVETLEDLLEDVENKVNIKRNIVRVGNRVKLLGKNQLEIKYVDTEALKLVSERTMELINGDLKTTWMAAQLVDMDGKLGESAKLIVRYMIGGSFATVLDPIPLVAEGELIIVFLRILVALCRIWRVPKNLEHAMFLSVTTPGAIQAVFRDLLGKLVGIAGILAAAAAIVLSGGVVAVAAPAMLVWLASYGVACGRKSMCIRGCYSVVILGCIMYVMSTRKLSGTWDEATSVEEYKALCECFAASEHHDCLTRVVKEMKDLTGMILRSTAHMDKFVSALVDCLGKMVLHRPTSLLTVMESEQATPENVVDDLAKLQDSLEANLNTSRGDE